MLWPWGHSIPYLLCYLFVGDGGPSSVKVNSLLSGRDDRDPSSNRDPSINEGLLLPLPLSPIKEYPLPVLPLVWPLPTTASNSLMTTLATRLASASSINDLISSAINSSRSMRASATEMSASLC